MSFILDALKRAERERAQGQAPAAAQIVQPAAVPAPRQSKVLMWVLLGLCVLLGGAVATVVWLVQRQNEAPQAVAAPIATMPANPSPAPMPAAAPPAETSAVAPSPAVARSAPAVEESAPAEAMPMETADSRPMKTLDDLSDDEPPPAAGPESDPEIMASSPPDSGAVSASPRPQPERKPRPAPVQEARAESRTPRTEPAVAPPPRGSARGAVSGPVIELPLQAPSAAQPVSPSAAATVAEGVTTAASSPRPAAPGSSSLRQMPEAYRAQFPQLNVDIHVYNEDPKRRFVMIAGRRYHEGETLAEGPRLIGIVPEGMVLEYQGQRVVYGNAR